MHQCPGVDAAVAAAPLNPGLQGVRRLTHPVFSGKLKKEDAMSSPGCLDAPVSVPAQRPAWPPAVKLFLAFVAALALLSPAILGLYWEILLPK